MGLYLRSRAGESQQTRAAGVVPRRTLLIQQERRAGMFQVEHTDIRVLGRANDVDSLEGILVGRMSKAGFFTQCFKEERKRKG